MIRYLFKTKKYGDGTKSKKEFLIPYDAIIENKYVKTKFLKGGIKHFGVIKFKGRVPWNEAEFDREAFLGKFVSILDSITSQISIVRYKELVDYSNNFNSLKTNMDVKIHSLINNDSKAEVIDAFTKLYEEKYHDFDVLDNDIMLDNYYIVVYDKKLSELIKTIEAVYTTINSMELEPELLEGKKLVNFISKQFGSKINDELIDKYFLQQEKSYSWKHRRNDDEVNKQDLIMRIKSWFITKFKKQNEPDEAKQDDQIKLSDLFELNKVVFKPSYFKIDEKYYSIQTVAELPLRLDEAWTYDLLNNESKIVWNLGAITYDSVGDILDKGTRRTKDNATIIKSGFSQKGNNLQLEAIEYLENQIQIDKNNLFDSHFMIINEADSLEELRKIESQNYADAKRAKILVKSLPFRQFEAFAQSLFITTNNLNEAMQISSYNVSRGWGFENEYQNDGNLCFIGTTINTAEPVIVDRFYKKNSRRTNYNWMTLGSSGKGKSTSKSKSIVDALMENHNVYVVDIENEYKYLSEKFGGSVFNLGTDSGTSLNPLEIRVQIWEEDNGNEEVDFNINSVIKKHNEWLENFFKLISDDFTNEHIMLIMTAVRRLYEKLNVYQVKSIDELNKIEFPIIDDLIEELQNFEFADKYEKERKQLSIARILDVFKYLFQYNGKFEKLYNAKTNINLDNDFIIFNTKELMSLGKEDNSVGTYVLLSLIQNLVYQNIIKNPNKHTVAFIDEIHQYVNVNRPIMLDFIWKLTKTGRKYLLSLDLTTQSPSDLLVSDKAESIVQNCQYSTFFGLKSRDLKAVKQMYEFSGGLNSSATSFLSDGEIGHNMISLHLNSKIKIDAWYNDYEKSLYFKQGDFKKINN
ncbi:conjugal transfer protein TraE [Mycoplasma zalophidermidis]|uniref:Conjugal transfer protein TraE n=2 Tax=Mycoplasma zalophidermidis TaxID=398174 RepID=A0ABS6DR13_9MOLU|nr:conjugal transfer protein TraE [Mycoplasma zalophidermidis]MBU4693429.1 conjugal transfer protein TraE [Mycoplasma zalophidermidis]